MKKTLIFTSILITIVFIIKYNISLIIQMVKKVKARESVESVMNNISDDVYSRLKPDLERLDLTKLDTNLVIIGLKEERILEVYLEGGNGLNLLKRYPFTAYSGELGPKLKEGDKQIPEGVYEIEYLNPNSLYYLSMKIDYPNEFDRRKSKFENVNEMGNDIFIHGKSATIGCIPIGDEAIEELFYLVQKAEKKRVKVIISPRDFRKNNSFPEINSIDWEKELYNDIREELNKIPVT